MSQTTITRRADTALATLDALHKYSTDDERLVTFAISAARDGIIAAYQESLDLDAARVASTETAKSVIINLSRAATGNATRIEKT